MVYCSKCGTNNEEGAESCAKCGANLFTHPARRHERRRQEEECFGLPHGGAIAGLLIGIIIIVVGLSIVPGLIPTEISEVADSLFWATIIIIFGVLIIAGALYKQSNR